jgi:hypothetical protein
MHGRRCFHVGDEGPLPLSGLLIALACVHRLQSTAFWKTPMRKAES